MISPLDGLKEALEQFASSDDATREKGYSKLLARSRPYLTYQLSSSRLSEVDREDVIQDVFERVWRSRDRLEFSNVGAWWRYLRTLCSNRVVDLVRSREPSSHVEHSEWMNVPDDEVELIDDLVETLEDRRRLYRLADEVFLEVSDDLSERERARQLLAAKLLLVDKMPWQTVCRVMNAGSSDEVQIDRKDLDTWLSSPPVIRNLAYIELYWTNDRLCDYLLAGCGSKNRAVAKTSSPDWTQDEILAVQLRFRHTMLLDHVAARMTDRMTKQQLIEIFDSCAQRFPFVDIVRRLNSDFGYGAQAREQLRSQGLWYRLVFQYYSYNGLPHRDIYDRTYFAAKEVGYAISMGTLNVGLSNGRLFKRLSDHLSRKREYFIDKSATGVQ